MIQSVVIWGAGGHAGVVADIVKAENRFRLTAFIDDTGSATLDKKFGLPVLSEEEEIRALVAKGWCRVIIAIGDCRARCDVAAKAKGMGFHLVRAIHPSVVIGSNVEIGAGTVVMPGAVININTKIGENVIVNTGSKVDHDCVVGNGVHIAPAVAIAGAVHIGTCTVVGVGAIVRDHVTIEPDCVIGAGAVVVRDALAHCTYVGIPAEKIRNCDKDPGLSHLNTYSKKFDYDYSIVVPVYFNEASLDETYKNLVSVMKIMEPEITGEVVFVDDGSGDGSYERLLEIQNQGMVPVRVVKFTRNFGQVSAIKAGLTHSRGRIGIVISADGQDPPQLIEKMLKSHMEEGYQVVIGTRASRDESAFRTLTSKIFYRTMKRLSFPEMPEGGFDFFSLAPQAKDCLLDKTEAQPFLQGQIMWLGFTPKIIKYHRAHRQQGTSKWTFFKKFTYLLDGVLGYSFAPIRLISVTGLAMAFLGFIYSLIVLAQKVFFGNPVEGWTPLMVVILVLGGVQLLALGVFGEYMWRILAQVQKRPPYVIEYISDSIISPD